jgi:hypothetical protein
MLNSQRDPWISPEKDPGQRKDRQKFAKRLRAKFEASLAATVNGKSGVCTWGFNHDST